MASHDVIVISTRKVLRDLIILVPLLLLAGWGVRESGWLEPRETTPSMGGMQASAPVQAPAGTSNDVLEVLAHLDRNSIVLLATIAGQEFTQGDIDTRVYNLLTRLNRVSDDNIKAEIQADLSRVQVIFEISREIALEEEAAHRQIVIADDEVDARIGSIIESFGSPEEFEEQLASMDADMDGMRDLTRQSMRTEKLEREILAELGFKPEDEGADQAYEQWLIQRTAGLDVQILDPRFRESMTNLLEMFQDAPDHGMPALPSGHPSTGTGPGVLEDTAVNPHGELGAE